MGTVRQISNRWRLGMCLVWCVAFAACKSREPLPNAPEAPAVLVALADRQEFPALRRRGTVAAGARLRLGFSLPGVLASVCCRTGDRIRQGQVVATLRAHEANARLRAANAAHSKASRDFSNSSALVETGALAPNYRDEARDQLDAAEAQTALASEVVRLTQLTAPVSATVQQRLAEPGETVGPAMPVLLVEEVGRLVVRVGVTQTELNRLATGSQATISADTGDAIASHIANIAPVPDPNDGLFSVEVRPDQKTTRLRPGALVLVEFRPKQSEKRVHVPLDALVERAGRSGVFIVDDSVGEAKARFCATTVYRIDGKDAWIADGLVGGERIIAEGAYFIEDGARVRVMAPGAASHAP